MSIVSRSRIRDAACAADISMTKLIGEALELVCRELIIVPEYMVVGGATGTL